jgi:hypothetical protein
LEFQALTLDHIDGLRPFFLGNECRICDCTIGGTFMWRDLFETQYAVEEGVLYLKAKYLTGDTAFAPPRGEGAYERAAYEHLLRYCRDNGLRTRLCAVSEALLELVSGMFPGARSVTDRAWSDYLYDAESIRGLAGRRYSGQRNHINKFTREYPGWTFERVTEENIARVREFFVKYSAEHIKDYPAYNEGNRKTIELIDNFSAYGQLGGALCVDGQIAGASFGERVGDTLFVHVEKADTNFQGSYPMLVNQFAGAFADGDVMYINREEDDGVEGLRTSKLSYHPTALLDKYVVELD